MAWPMASRHLNAAPFRTFSATQLVAVPPQIMSTYLVHLLQKKTRANTYSSATAVP